MINSQYFNNKINDILLKLNGPSIYYRCMMMCYYDYVRFISVVFSDFCSLYREFHLYAIFQGFKLKSNGLYSIFFFFLTFYFHLLHY